MTLDQIMIWRFRNIEGVLADIKSWNMDTCEFNNGTIIKYDFKNLTITINNRNSLFGKSATLPIKDCNKDILIKEYGFIERFDNRHGLSFKQEEIGG